MAHPLFQALEACALFLLSVIAISLTLGVECDFTSAVLRMQLHGPVHRGPQAGPNTSTTNPAPATQYESVVRDAGDYVLGQDWNAHATPTTRSYNFTLSEVLGAPDGVVRPLRVINGEFPGPLIRLNSGDRLLINVTNHLSQPTSLHWHGLLQNGSNWMDGVSGITQCGIPPGKSFLYNFTVTGQFGTYWYHSHYGTQRGDGQFGPLIVHAPEEEDLKKEFGYESDQVVLLQDYYHKMSDELLQEYLAPEAENNEPVPDGGLIQGRNRFECSRYDHLRGMQGPKPECHANGTRYGEVRVAAGKKHRIRLINVGLFATHQFEIDEHNMTVVEGDATLVEPLQLQTLSVAVGQRYSFIIDANHAVGKREEIPPSFWMRAQMDTSCFKTKNKLLDIETKAILTYTTEHSEQKSPVEHVLHPPDSKSFRIPFDPLCRDLNTSLLAPLKPQRPPPADHLYVVQMGFHTGAYALSRAVINGTTWRPSVVPTLQHIVSSLHSDNTTLQAQPAHGLRDQYILEIPSGTQIVDILLQNFDDGSHPFHLHGHDFWVMAESEEQYFPYAEYQKGTGLFHPSSPSVTNPMRRDTVNVNGYGWTLIRLAADNPGVWALHCHVSWHLAAGLLMQLLVGKEQMADWEIPGAVKDLCHS
ncbi:hypothetical protein KEM55_002613 [Ascosphaera atra]|nr:hypothetical protein KEM55_002613 [Ascosphaera atra]